MLSHVVILGAGATVAAIPNGDKHGIKSPTMSNFFQTTKINNLLEKFNIECTSTNLEDIYSILYDDPKYQQDLYLLNNAIYEYFSKLTLPDEPTIYDLLLLGLTNKDLVATFNWDPLLIQAYIRCSNITRNLPKITFLHGNVALGYCPNCLEYGTIEMCCPVCSKPFVKSQLLFPIKNKNYNNDELIKGFWQITQEYIKNASMVTVFGYSAPKSDIAAIKLFKSAWGNLHNRSLEEFSFIDIENEKDYVEKWRGFVYNNHYRYSNSFFDSYIALFPRRSCQVECATHNFNISHRTDLGYTDKLSFDELKNILYPLLCEEAKNKQLTSQYYIIKNQFKR